jgi:RNA polymerase I-specific transcription initiation factor RRN5
MAEITSEQDSASAYENSESEASISDNERNRNHRSRAFSNNKAKGKLQKRDSTPDVVNSNGFDEFQEKPILFQDDSSSERRIQEQTHEWAASFQPPHSAKDIKTPPRRNTQRKRNFQQTIPSAARVKRLRLYYNSEYRDVLNTDISDAVRRSTFQGISLLRSSQIGASIWTSTEKESFFTALERLGTSNLRSIAERIGSKSVLEVHEYVRLLDEGHLARDENEKERSMSTTKTLLDMPASFEISEECCAVLERAGEALDSYHQQHEEKVEKEKWGDCWLVNESVSRQLAKRNIDEEEDEGFREVLPAANLFDLKKWIHLSQDVFMNSTVKEDNWRILIENSETPAIRATALEDFHSLAVSFTRRLVSSTLFCTMSRQRAMSAKTINHGDITRDDVDAAIQILGVKPDSYDFWVKCPRKCNLSIIDSEESDDDEPLSYDEVEEVLKRNQRRRSRSRSRSRSVLPEYRTNSPSSDSASNSPVDTSDDETDAQPSTSESSNDGITDMSDNNQLSHNEAAAKLLLAKQEAEQAQENYINAIDKASNKFEETRLWAMLEQDPPFEMKEEPVDEPDSVHQLRRGRIDITSTWRDRTPHWSSWEEYEKPIPLESFEKNRLRVSKSTRMSAESLTREEVHGEEEDHHASGTSSSPASNISDSESAGPDGVAQEDEEDESMEDVMQGEEEQQPPQASNTSD